MDGGAPYPPPRLPVDEVRRLRHEVEVVVLVDEVVGRVLLRLQVARRPVAVDQLPAAVDRHRVPAVVERGAGERRAGAVLHALRPARDRHAEEAGVAG